jgi:hypothetical protein
VSKANRNPILFCEALQKPTRHEYIGLVVGLFQSEGKEQDCLFARFRCLESGSVRTFGAYENDLSTHALFAPEREHAN